MAEVSSQGARRRPLLGAIACAVLLGSFGAYRMIWSPYSVEELRARDRETAAEALAGLLAHGRGVAATPEALSGFGWGLGMCGSWEDALALAAGHPWAVLHPAEEFVLLLTPGEAEGRFEVFLYRNGPDDRLWNIRGYRLPDAIHVHGLKHAEGELLLDCAPRADESSEHAARSMFDLAPGERRWIEFFELCGEGRCLD